MPATEPEPVPPGVRSAATIIPAPPPPLGLYVHIPWCVRKCPYCDFNSHPRSGGLPEAAYVDALLIDLDQDAPGLDARPLHSIFIGGGTPSLFAPSSIARLLAGIRQRLKCAPALEITLEANPGTVDQARCEGYLNAGVNRLSLGVQSFSTESLQRLGRIHDSAQAWESVCAAHRAGVPEINLDLMYGLPGQTLPQALADLRMAFELDPQHLSYYQLTLEPHTAFGRHPPSLPDEALLTDIEGHAEAALVQAGFSRYEVSAYCQPDHPCQHNLNYWCFGDYLGIGAGAHGKLTSLVSGQVVRRWKLSHPRAYLAETKTRCFVAGRRALAPEDLIAEFMMNALRLSEGFAPSLFESRTRVPFTRVLPIVGDAVERGLLESDTHGVRTTALGRRFLNDLLALFIPEPRSQHRR